MEGEGKMLTFSILTLMTRHNPVRAFVRWVAGCGRSFARFCDRRETIRILQDLDDHQLKDLGISRYRIAQAARDGFFSRPEWR
jgi:uncharacterized protein YjiS (DUF1127 family)